MGEARNRKDGDKPNPRNPTKGRTMVPLNHQKQYTAEDLAKSFQRGLDRGEGHFMEKLGIPKHTALSTPSSRWSEEGAADPHDHKHYLNAERATLTLGNLTDDELANAVYMHGNPSDAEKHRRLLNGDIMDIAYLTAAKERIRWTSRQLEAALEANRQFADRMDAIWSLLLNSPQGASDLEVEARKVLPGYFVDAKLEEMEIATQPTPPKRGDVQVEEKAQEIYNSWSGQEGWKPWVAGGNSFKQEEARSEALEILLREGMTLPAEQVESIERQLEENPVAKNQPLQDLLARDKPWAQ